MEYDIFNPPPNFCDQAKILLFDWRIQLVRWILVFLCLATGLLLFLVAKQYKKQPRIVHRNLILLLNNILFHYLLDILFILAIHIRYQILAIFYTNSCQLTTPVLLVLLLRIPSTLHIVAIPLTHLAILIERMRATMFVNNYEAAGTKAGWRSIFIIWFLVLSFLLFTIIYHLEDFVDPSKPVQWVVYIPRLDTTILCYFLYFLLFLLAINSMGVWLVYGMNRKLHQMGHVIGTIKRFHYIRKNSEQNAAFTLSQKYQMRENLATLRILIPLDISYLLFFLLYLLATYFIRQYKNTPIMPGNIHYVIYDCANLLIFGHSTATLTVFYRFLKISQQKRKAVIVQPATGMDEGIQYFNFLRYQWNS